MMMLLSIMSYLAFARLGRGYPRTRFFIASPVYTLKPVSNEANKIFDVTKRIQDKFLHDNYPVEGSSFLETELARDLMNIPLTSLASYLFRVSPNVKVPIEVDYLLADLMCIKIAPEKTSQPSAGPHNIRIFTVKYFASKR